MNPPKSQSAYLNLNAGLSDELEQPAARDRFFEIRINGQLSDMWADWFEGLSVEFLDSGDTLLSGYIVDQSALMGVLNKLVRLNLNLISLNEIQTQKEKK